MIKKLWQRLTTGQPGKRPQQAIIVPRDAHCVSRKDISNNALKVLYRLNDAGYQAYLVGGGVRDILLGLSPKDFDIATDATPEQVSQLFRNSRLIGRRFRLAHILFGREVIEVATFRAGHESSCHTEAKTSEQGMLVRDNVYGNLEEDAFRRDFTVNALYYCVRDFSVIDYTGGLTDLENGLLRLIGDPAARYREDPVRILRAIRLSAKLDLQIEKNTAAPIVGLAELLDHVAAARLWDESNKLLLAGHAFKTWHLLIKYQVAEHIFAQTIDACKSEKTGHFKAFIDSALKSTDSRIEKSMPVTPAFLFAVFLWEPMNQLTRQMIDKGVPSFEASQKAAAKVFEQQRNTVAIPKRFSITAREIWSLQFRLLNRRKRTVNALLQHPRFRAAYDFLCLRAGEDKQLNEIAQWWTEIQDAGEDLKHKMLSELEALPRHKGKRKNKSRRAGSHRAPQKSQH